MTENKIDAISDFYFSVENYRTQGPWQIRDGVIYGPDGGRVIYGGRDGALCGDEADIELAVSAPELHRLLGEALTIIASLTEKIEKITEVLEEAD